MENQSDRWSPENESRLHYDVVSKLSRNARGVDRRDWALMRSTYHDDAVDHHGVFQGGPLELAEYLESRAEHVAVMHHVLGQTLLLTVDRVARRVVAETACVGYQVLKPGAPVPALFDVGDGTAGVCVMGVRYADEFEERGGDLRIARRTVVHEWSSVAPSTTAVFVEGKIAGIRDTSDFSYTAIDQEAQS